MRGLFLLALLLPFLGCSAPEEPLPLSEVVASITMEDVQTRIGILAHDSMGGRDTPSPGLEMAAAWAANEFQRMGLEPGGDEGSFIQRYAYTPRSRDGVAVASVDVPNVVGLIRGSDPVLRDEWVVFTAHFDHVSGPPDDTGDDIYNGADDNASGTAAIMEVAEAFAMLSTPPRRSTAFVLVSGEEKGLLGAAYFASGASLPHDAMVADINADMVSMNSPEGIFIHGAELSTMGAMLDEVVQAHPEVGISIMEDEWPQMPLIRMSDQYAFIEEGIPGIFFFSGLHPELHSPKDEPENVNYDKAYRVARLIFHFGLEVAQAEERVRWTEAGQELLAGIEAGER
jgi:Zn-dependent M28 family amino/carboxypeptidase